MRLSRARSIPPEWQPTPKIGTFVDRSVVKDVHNRTVNRHRRKRLAPVLFDHLIMNVEIARRKRYCLLRGFRMIYARVLAQWAMYVLLEMGKEEEAALKAAKERAAQEEGAVDTEILPDTDKAAAEGVTSQSFQDAFKKSTEIIKQAEAEMNAPAPMIDESGEPEASFSSAKGSESHPTSAGGDGSVNDSPAGSFNHGPRSAMATPDSKTGTPDTKRRSVARRGRRGSVIGGISRRKSVVDLEPKGRTYGMMLQRRYRVAPGGGGAALPDGAISMADFGEEAPEAQRERTVVDIRVSAKLDNKRRQVEMAGLRRKNKSSSAAADDDADAGMHHNDLQLLPGAERTYEYTKRLQRKQASIDDEKSAVEARGSARLRRAEQAAKRREAQDALMAAIEEQSRATLSEVEERNLAMMNATTSSLESLLANKVDNLARTYQKVNGEYSLAYSWYIAGLCLRALKEPVKWKRAKNFGNKWKLRRMLRICNRLNVLDRSMHRYYRLRTMLHVLYGWLYVTADSLARVPKGFGPMLKRRRQRLLLFSRLLQAERSEKCPRCLFARWCEYVQYKVAKRNIVECSLERINAQLLGKVFHAWRGGITASQAKGRDQTTTDQAVVDSSVEVFVGGALELKWASRLDKWAKKVMGPGTFAEWLRRKNRWVRRRQHRLIAEGELRVGLAAMQTDVKERVAHEAELQFDRQQQQDMATSGFDDKSIYLSGALKLREFELTSLWSACNAVAKAVHYTDKSDTPRWAEPLRPAHISLGLARWMFNALSHGLPRKPPPDGQPSMQEAVRTRLPKRTDDSTYWKHFDWLVEESERRTKKAQLAGAAWP